MTGVQTCAVPADCTKTLSQAGTVAFGEITYPLESAGKTYNYKITEASDWGTGWSVTPTEITATVVVSADTGSGELTTKVTYDPEDFTFTNDYDASGKAKLEAKKALGEGDTWPDGKIATFTLTAITAGAPMPAAAD